MINSQAISITVKNVGRFNTLLLTGFVFAMLIYSVTANAEDDLKTLDEALEFVLSNERVPHASEVKIQEIHATYADDMRVWKFTFIDSSTIHVAKVDKKKRFHLESTEDKEAYNEVFWADRPRAEGMFKKDWLYEAEKFIESNNYVLSTPTILNFKVCDTPKGDAKSKFPNGCLEDTFKETWTIVRGVEGRKLAKMVVYGDGQLDVFNNVTVELSGQ